MPAVLIINDNKNARNSPLTVCSFSKISGFLVQYNVLYEVVGVYTIQSMVFAKILVTTKLRRTK
ncbi:hypothetical protein MASR2M29_04580 [Spirochaetota bacterium]